MQRPGPGAFSLILLTSKRHGTPLHSIEASPDSNPHPMSSSSAPTPDTAGPSPNPVKRSKHRALPGFGLTMGYTLLYLSIIILIPLSSTVLKTLNIGIDGFLGAHHASHG